MLALIATVGVVSAEFKVNSLCRSSISSVRLRGNNQRSLLLSRPDHSKRLQSHKIHKPIELMQEQLEQLEELLHKIQGNKMMEITLSTSIESTNLPSIAQQTENTRPLLNIT
jgi:hypothetical protein